MKMNPEEKENHKTIDGGQREATKLFRLLNFELFVKASPTTKILGYLGTVGFFIIFGRIIYVSRHHDIESESLLREVKKVDSDPEFKFKKWDRISK